MGNRPYVMFCLYEYFMNEQPAMFFAAVTVEILLESAPSQFLDSHLEYYLSSYIILGWCAFFVLRNFAAPKRLQCNPGEAYMRLITASCEAGPGATPMCTFEICMWRILILDLLTDVPFETQHLACESGICTLNK